jgi:Phosphodiester glycosidase
MLTQRIILSGLLRGRLAPALLAAWLLVPAQAQAPSPLAATSASPIAVERFAKPGPVAGVVARINLRDPRVAVKVFMADGLGPGGGKDCAGRLEVPSALARKHDLAVALNASYFRAEPKASAAPPVTYFVGNCGTPVGWHVAEGQVRARPVEARFEAAFVVHASGRATLHARLHELPADARFVVSGNALVLERGQVATSPKDTVRHPRSAVGLSEDGQTLLLVAVDGRQEGHSRGVTLAELGELMKAFGATDALNLDGGGSTTLVLKDHLTGVFTVANRPSGLATDLPSTHVERPVVDVLGVVVREAPAPRQTPAEAPGR